MIFGDFNIIETIDFLQDLMHDLNLESIVKEPTWFKSVNPTCIYFIFTSESGKFSNIRTIETGISDFHAMVATVLRGSFRKKGHRIVTYRDYSGFDNFSFREEVVEEPSSHPLKMLDFSLFNSAVDFILEKMAQLKKKYLRANVGPFVTNELRKAIMKRLNVKKKFNEIRANENRAAYKRQRNLCVRVLRQNEKSYYARLAPETVSENKKFWKTVKPLFSNEIQSASCITLLENAVVESDEGKAAEIMNNFFLNITETLVSPVRLLKAL